MEYEEKPKNTQKKTYKSTMGADPIPRCEPDWEIELLMGYYYPQSIKIADKGYMDPTSLYELDSTDEKYHARALY